jgi:hypothetical protein
MLKTCFVCSNTVERADCHKNRYGKYICRKCQSAGVTPTLRQRVRNLIAKMRTMERKLWLMLIRVLLVAFALWIFFRILASVDS